MKVPINCVVFDFDGTLVDSNRIKRDAFFEIARQHDGGFDAMKLVYARGRGDRFEIWKSWAVELGTDQFIADEMIAAYSAAVDKAVAAAPEMPGAFDMLVTLKAKGLSLILSSATPKVSLASIINARGWLSQFDAIYGAPEPKGDILTRHVVPKAGGVSRVAVVGDGSDDRESARATGCRFYPVGEALGAPQSSDEHIYSLSELATLLG